MRINSRLIVCAVLVAVLMVSACSIESRDGAQRSRAIVAGWFMAMAAGEGDRGWELLHPEAREWAFRGDRDAYIGTVDAADWTPLEFHIETSTWRDVVYQVDVDVNRPDLLPSFLVERYLVQKVERVGGDMETGLVVLVRLDEAGEGIRALAAS